MTRIIILFGILFTIGSSISTYAEDMKHSMEAVKKHHHMMQVDEPKEDGRISLQLTPHMKQHQLANMRSHVEAIQSIIGMMAEDKFDQASTIAHNKLGLTPMMKKMCNMSDNDDFKKFGLAFHKSADELGNVLKTRNIKLSLTALHKTMSSCVQCHATFRQ